MRHPLLACLCLCTALTSPCFQTSAIAADTVPISATENDLQIRNHARARALGIANVLLHSSKGADKFWEDEIITPSETSVKKDMKDFGSRIDLITDKREKARVFVTRFAHFWRDAKSQDITLLLTNVKALCLVPTDSGGVDLSDPFITNAFVDIAQQLYEANKLPRDHIQSLKELGRLGHVGARNLYTRIIGESEMNLYQKIHALAFFKAVADPVGTPPSLWLRELLQRAPKDKNFLSWDEARATLFKIFSDHFTDFDEETLKMLWRLMLENPPEDPGLSDPMFKVVTDAVARAIPDATTPETMAWRMLLEEIGDEKHKGAFDFLKNPLFSKPVKLHQFAEVTKSVSAYQAWASYYVSHGMEEPSLKRAQLLEEMTSTSESEENDDEKARGIGNVLALAMTLNQNNTPMALMSQLRMEIKTAFDIAEGDAKITLQKRLWILDQLLVMHGKAATTEVYNEAAATLNTLDNAEAFAYVQDQLSQKRAASPFLPAALGFDAMTPQERFINLLEILKAPLSMETFIKVHYGAVAFNNEWFDDPLALWGQHFGLAEVALADIHAQTGRTNHLEFLTHTQVLSALLESAIQHNSRTAQMYVLKYIEKTRDVFQKQRNEALAKAYDAYLGVLESSFIMMRVADSM